MCCTLLFSAYNLFSPSIIHFFRLLIIPMSALAMSVLTPTISEYLFIFTYFVYFTAQN